MKDSGDFLRKASLARAALAALEQHDLAPEPQNYALFYAYASGSEPLLKEAVDGILREEGALSRADLAMLCRAFLRDQALGLTWHELPLDPIGNAPSASRDATTSAAAALSAAHAAATRNGSRTATIDLVRRLVAATRSIEERKRLIEEELVRSRAELDALQASLDNVRHETLNDQLTTLASRRHFDEAFERAIAGTRESGAPLSLLFTDIDHFKSFNDRYGHQTGDHVLRLVALAVKQNVREQDTACRYGGEEFAVILPGTAAAEAMVIGEEIRAAVMGREFRRRASGEKLRPVTISIGIASFLPGDTASSLIERADRCLYRAKSSGRNLVMSDDGQPLRERA
ncbi:GGDEF domain-containing protein [Kaistia geumhonensis]|uniref:diguanylate cyclase n=1 Tax=Kaistia geumhonensis TaxID=410839 RepID=A0ABU0M365_9HYPH|nr:GGDEF domain-containing protein [Kaistia geumhonensis]MCX5479380.1 GGDEF domain-containing protein [Kaistia geumhonensis]MDQ0515397.1 diguanylate cyclase [Kaistia geumhonensis]